MVIIVIHDSFQHKVYRKSCILQRQDSSISSTRLPEMLQGYHMLYPETTFDLRVGTDILSEWLRSGTVDLALGDSVRCQGFR